MIWYCAAEPGAQGYFVGQAVELLAGRSWVPARVTGASASAGPRPPSPGPTPL